MTLSSLANRYELLGTYREKYPKNSPFVHRARGTDRFALHNEIECFRFVVEILLSDKGRVRGCMILTNESEPDRDKAGKTVYIDDLTDYLHSPVKIRSLFYHERSETVILAQEQLRDLADRIATGSFGIDQLEKIWFSASTSPTGYSVRTLQGGGCSPR